MYICFTLVALLRLRLWNHYPHSTSLSRSSPSPSSAWYHSLQLDLHLEQVQGVAVMGKGNIHIHSHIHRNGGWSLIVAIHPSITSNLACLLSVLSAHTAGSATTTNRALHLLIDAQMCSLLLTPSTTQHSPACDTHISLWTFLNRSRRPLAYLHRR